MSKHKVLVISHGHPDFNLGGGELAAYNLFKAYKNHSKVDDAWFIGRIDRGNGPTGAFSRRRPNEYLWEQGLGDSFKLKVANSYSIWHEYSNLIQTIKPTIIHAHHYFHIGLEFLRITKRILPDCKIFLTLHEYIAICLQQGQMIKRGTNDLCLVESYEDCHRCIPEFSREQYWLRKQFIQCHFDFVDHFIAPSEFLRQRYIKWGINPDHISVIENGQDDLAPLPPRKSVSEDGPINRFAFFGQINPFKGVDLLLEAITQLSRNEKKQIKVEIHGANLEWQPEEFKARFNNLLQPLIREGCVRMVGPYKPEQLRSRMSRIDWVIVPSIWWENSPMVIQEAFLHGRPVICSNIGGMAEKVSHMHNGLHFEARNPLDLADSLLRAVFDSSLWTNLYNNIKVQRPLTHVAGANKHLDLLDI